MVIAPSRRIVLFLLIVSLLTPIPPAWADDIVRTPTEPSYEVSLHAGPAGRVWKGIERITFTNAETDPLSTIYVRLWSNGVLGCRAHAIEVSQIEGGTPRDLAERCTVLPIDLDRPVASGDEVTISMRVTIAVPEHNDRFGWYRGLALMGSALPILAVHDDQGWHLPPFVDLGESFYSIVGDYVVTLNVPQGLETPTTGIATDERITSTRRITTYEASDVRDFEWAAGDLARVRGRSGATEIVAWFQRRGMDRDEARRALRDARTAMDAFSAAFGAYPYREMDVVLTAFATFGGMEYPTIIFTNPTRITISHEIAHQWWYGIVGNDEYAEPWLDESFATWSQRFPFEPWTGCTNPNFPSADARLTSDMGYWRDHPFEYGTVYSVGGCMLANLASRFGLDRFLQVLRTYARDHWLGVARTADFTSVIEEAAVRDGLSGFDPDRYWSHWRVD
jgi:hypothetical protein